MKYEVRYPSGRKFIVSGVLRCEVVPGVGLNPFIFKNGKSAVGLDPRAIVSSSSGLVVYGPRKHSVELPSWASEWLSEHPDWDSENVTDSN